jgi:hypothetical protein
LTLNRCLAPKGGRDDVLDVLDHDAVACERRSVRRHVEVVATDAALCVGRRCAWHGFDDLFNLLRKLVYLNQVGTDHLDPDRRPDPGRQHVDAGPDRHGPGVRHTWKLQRLVHFRGQAIDCHARTPLLLRLEIDDRLEHFGGRRIGRRLCASGFAVHGRHLGKRADDPVLHLDQFGGLGD